MPDCLFCKIIKGDVPSDKVFENENVFAFKDIHPKAPIHILIVPKRHIGSLASITTSDSSEIPHLFMAAQEIANKFKVKESGFRTIFNTGADAGMMVDHLHLHLLAGRRLQGMR